MPKASIIIVTYNRAELIADAIQSALDQTIDDFELLIIDDGSTDNTKEVVASFDSSKIKYVYKNHSGIPDSRNRGIKEARGEFIVWLDSDDMLMPNILELELEVVENDPAVGVVYVDHHFMNSVKEIVYHCYDLRPDSREDLISRSIFNSPIRNLGAMVRKSLFEQAGYYDVSLKKAEDHDFWLRAIKHTQFKHLPVFLCKRRLHFGRTTHKLSKQKKDETEVFRRLIRNFSLQEVFPELNWNKEPKDTSEAKAYYKIARVFYAYGSYEESLKYLKKSLQYFSPWKIKILLSKIYFRRRIPNIIDRLEYFRDILSK